MSFSVFEKADLLVLFCSYLTIFSIRCIGEFLNVPNGTILANLDKILTITTTNIGSNEQ